VKNLRDLEFWAALSIIIATVLLMAAINLRWIQLGFEIGPFRLNHWLVWAGTLYVAFAVPIIAMVKRRSPSKFLALLRIHVFGNLAAFLLISLHFASQFSRPPTSYPELGTGLALYIVMMLLTATGFVQRFNMAPKVKPQQMRFFHTSLAISFYLIIVIHILHGLGIL
jgi:hypothetical protein